MRIAAVSCPACGYEFIVDVEFLEIEESYCHCPRCTREFKAGESGKPVRT